MVEHCDVQGGYTGTGNFSCDPAFVNAAANDFHLRSGSACINNGVTAGVFLLPDHDFEGDPRTVGFETDVGADEFAGPVAPGSGEDFALELLVNGTIAARVSTGDAVTARMYSPQGIFAGSVPALLAQVYSCASPPIGLAGQGFPSFQLDLAGVIVLFDGSLGLPFGPVLLPPGSGLSLLFNVGVIPAGFSTRVQALAITSAANSGFFAASDGVDLFFD